MLLSVQCMVEAPPTSVIIPFIGGKTRHLKRSLGIAWRILQRRSEEFSTDMVLCGWKVQLARTLII